MASNPREIRATPRMGNPVTDTARIMIRYSQLWPFTGGSQDGIFPHWVKGDANGFCALYTNTVINFILCLTITKSFGADTDEAP